MKKLFATLLAVVSLSLLAGCLPPEFTKENAKKLAKEHYSEAVEWFAQNYPEAKVSENCSSVDDGRNLYSAVKGSYKANGETYHYIYSYFENAMYLDEDYAAVCGKVQELVCDEQGISVECSKFLFQGIPVYVSYMNDNPSYGVEETTADQESQSTESAKTYHKVEGYLPAQIDVLEYAKQTLRGETELPFAIYFYVDEIPKMDPQIFESYPNMTFVEYSRPVDMEFDGVYSSIWYETDWKIDNYYHTEKIEDDFYAGFVVGIDSRKADMDTFDLSFSYEDQGNGEFLLHIPEKASPIFYTKNRTQIAQIYVDGNGKTGETNLSEMESSACPGYADCRKYAGLFVVRNLQYKGYKYSNYNEKVRELRFRK